jgi:hypothetical protein
MSTNKINKLITQGQKITAIYRCFNLQIPKKFNYQKDGNEYNETNYNEDVEQFISMKKHPFITQMGFYIHPTNKK